jgi:hypothetical protein
MGRAVIGRLACDWWWFLSEEAGAVPVAGKPELEHCWMT